MYSGTDKNTTMSFSMFKGIVDSCEDEFELQLEGGEPLLNRNLYLFMEYAVSTGRCMKVIILSNGILIRQHINRIYSIANWYPILIELKISINYWLLKQVDGFLEEMNELLFFTKDTDYINVVFNVRKRKDVDEGMDELLKNYGLYDRSNIFYLQSYGKLKDSNYDKPIIVQNIGNWRIYASDGTCFNQDLIARSEYEKDLI